VLAQGISRLTEYYTSTHERPVQEIADATRTGPATTVLAGISTGLESSVWAIVAIAASLGVSILLGDGNLQFSLYLVALTGMGMLATRGWSCPGTLTAPWRTAPPASPNVSEFSARPRGYGRLTQAHNQGGYQGVCHRLAVIAAVALFASFVR
jgi:K(+)-stimulated pyrophosphate-energized sodium pump